MSYDVHLEVDLGGAEPKRVGWLDANCTWNVRPMFEAAAVHRGHPIGVRTGAPSNAEGWLMSSSHSPSGRGAGVPVDQFTAQAGPETTSNPTPPGPVKLTPRVIAKDRVVAAAISRHRKATGSAYHEACRALCFDEPWASELQSALAALEQGGGDAK